MGRDLHHLWETFRFEYLEREPIRHTISSGEESAKRIEDIGELRKVYLRIESDNPSIPVQKRGNDLSPPFHKGRSGGMIKVIFYLGSGR